MRRFYLEEIDEDKELVELGGEEFRHLKNVLRLGCGDLVRLFDGSGCEFEAVIDTIGEKSAILRLIRALGKHGESGVAVRLVVALTKGGKPELVVEKATELGVKELVFYSSERSVPRLGGERIEKRLERFKKVAISAAKQSNRCVLPTIAIKEIESALRDTGEKGLKVLLYEGEGELGLKEVLATYGGGGVVLAFGPEGGLSENEVEAARAEGFVTAGLGPRILRAETAVLVATGITQYELGDMR